MRNDLAVTFSCTEAVKDADDNIVIHASELLERKGLVGTYFDQTSHIYLERAVPRVKVSLAYTLSLGDMNIYLRNTYFGQTTEVTGESIFDADSNLLSDATIDPYNDGKIIPDLSLGYQFTDNLTVTVGANNLLNIYPDDADPAFTSSDRFVYSRRSPNVNIHGRHLFARVAFTLK